MYTKDYKLIAINLDWIQNEIRSFYYFILISGSSDGKQKQELIVWFRESID